MRRENAFDSPTHSLHTSTREISPELQSEFPKGHYWTGMVSVPIDSCSTSLPKCQTRDVLLVLTILKSYMPIQIEVTCDDISQYETT